MGAEGIGFTVGDRYVIDNHMYADSSWSDSPREELVDFGDDRFVDNELSDADASVPLVLKTGASDSDWEPCDELIAKKPNVRASRTPVSTSIVKRSLRSTVSMTSTATTSASQQSSAARRGSNVGSAPTSYDHDRCVSSQRLTKSSVVLHLEMRILIRLRDGVAARGDRDQSQLHLRV